MKHIICSLLLFVFVLSAVPTMAEYYELRIYHVADRAGGTRVDKYLQAALLPALHRHGVAAVGVFKPVESDTVNMNRIYVLIPYASLADFVKTNEVLAGDAKYAADGRDFLEASYDNPPYVRMEVIILEAFPMAPKFQVPKLKSAKADRVYELRSYESATANLHRKKVKMFNEGGEIEIFTKLNFNAVFYSRVLSGSHMPNLMYMTSFESMDDRNMHWDAFRNAPEWKKLSAIEEYKNTVSKIESFLLHGTPYSDF